jgi:hypothetical protein
MVPVADPSFGWQEAMAAYLVVLIAAFAVTWLVTDVLGVGRTLYIGVLTIVVGSIGAWYLTWSGTSFTDIAGSNLAWGLVAGLAVAGAVTPLVRRMPSGRPTYGLRRAELFAWEDFVYGIDEALLLAVYPVLTIWQATVAAGWTDTDAGKIAAGGLAIVGSLLVILAHHLGYAEFRQPAARPKLLGALLTCGLQGLAFLVTGTLLAPVVAHVALHFEFTLRGTELPPVMAVDVRHG